MKIIRCLWGNVGHQFYEKDLDTYHSECKEAKIQDEKYGLDNQMVIVWDEVNCKLMEKLGYPYLYMGESKFDKYFNFYYKILALERAMELYDEILFLDWDCFIQKPLDDNFYSLLRNKGDIQIPLYYYCNDILDLYEPIDPKRDDEFQYYNLLFYNLIRHGKWKFADGLVVPNAGFIYCRDKSFFKELIEIQRRCGIISNIEEICAMIYFNQHIETTEEYLEKIEPIVCLGRNDEQMRGKQIFLNQYTIKELNKDIYFIHE